MNQRHSNRRAQQKKNGNGKIKHKESNVKGKNNTPSTRAVKSDNSAKKVEPIKPLNGKQREYLEALKDPYANTILVSGVLGSSKTYLPSAMAADLLLAGKIKKVVIARPTEGKGKSVGFGKGSFNDKLSGWCAPVIDTMKDRMGLGQFEAALEYEKIIMLPLEMVKGRSWDDAWIIIDEAEDLEADVAKSLVTRTGMRSKVIITGDFAQQDLKHYSGLDLLMQVASFNKLPITQINFDSWEYCVRSQEARMWGGGRF